MEIHCDCTVSNNLSYVITLAKSNVKEECFFYSCRRIYFDTFIRSTFIMLEHVGCLIAHYTYKLDCFRCARITLIVGSWTFLHIHNEEYYKSLKQMFISPYWSGINNFDFWWNQRNSKQQLIYLYLVEMRMYTAADYLKAHEEHFHYKHLTITNTSNTKRREIEKTPTHLTSQI